MDTKKTNEKENLDKDAAVKPEPETLHTTDPQKNMEGPVSSLIKKGGENFDTDKSRAEADKEKDENM